MKNIQILLLDIVNPCAFYVFLVSQNYLIKTSNTLLIGITTFIPASIYIILKWGNLFDFEKISFKKIFYGLLFGLIDLSIMYMFLNTMKYNSTFVVLALSIIPFILFNQLNALPDLLSNALTLTVTYSLIKATCYYELFGYQSSLIINPSDSDTCTVHISLVSILGAIRLFFNSYLFENDEYPDIKGWNIFFFSIFSVFYLCIDEYSLSAECEAIKLNILLSELVVLSFTLWLVTLDNLSINLCRNYFLIYASICIFYFSFPLIPVWDVTRTESALYSLYLWIFGFICLIFMIGLSKRTPINLEGLFEEDTAIENEDLESLLV
jgi:hypothetical protein